MIVQVRGVEGGSDVCVSLCCALVCVCFDVCMGARVTRLCTREYPYYVCYIFVCVRLLGLYVSTSLSLSLSLPLSLSLSGSGV
jgi:hypothetical protein